MSHLGDLIDAYRLEHGASERFIAEKIGVSHALIGKWKKGQYVTVPGEPIMRALARQIRVPYEVVIQAALDDTYFKNDKPGMESDGDGNAAANTEALDAQADKIDQAVKSKRTDREGETRVRKSRRA